MAVTKHSKANPRPKKSSRSGRIIMLNAATNEYIKPSKAKKHPTTTTTKEKARMASAEIVLKASSVRALGARTKMVRKILEHLADAALKAERTGEAVALTIEIPPGEAGAVDHVDTEQTRRLGRGFGRGASTGRTTCG